MREKRSTAAWAWSLEPKKSQAFLPVATVRKAFSLGLLSMRSLPSSRKRRRASCCVLAVVVAFDVDRHRLPPPQLSGGLA